MAFLILRRHAPHQLDGGVSDSGSMAAPLSQSSWSQRCGGGIAMRRFHCCVAVLFALVLASSAAIASDYIIQDLGALDLGRNSTASAINKAGKVVGHSEGPDGLLHWIQWDAVNGMQDLGAAPIGIYCLACSINSRGQIAGTVGDSN